MTTRDRLVKRGFDLVVAALGLAALWPIIAATWVIAGYDTGASGFFRHTRVGQGGAPFKILKLRTMRNLDGTTVATETALRITTPWGAWFRRWKLDELPQLWNVLLGQMSFVGPRPDVAGYMDQLKDDDARLLELKPGITGPASLKYRAEQNLLIHQSDPQAYNDTVIWPDKVRINLEYMDNWSLPRDLWCIMETVYKCATLGWAPR